MKLNSFILFSEPGDDFFPLKIAKLKKNIVKTLNFFEKSAISRPLRPK